MIHAAEPGAAIPASIEVTPRQAIDMADPGELFPAATRVYLTDIGTEGTAVLVAAACRLRAFGCEPVPHFPARRLPSRAVLDDRLAAMAGEAGVTDVLVIGGGLGVPAGPFTSTMEVLETGLFDRHGITDIGIAGHPEGSPDFSDQVAAEALRLKRDFGERSGARMRVVTQFGFDGGKFVRWAKGVREAGIDLPVHLGVAGPARITTLIRFAAMCGVGTSLSYFRRNTHSIATLATSHSPESVVGPIEAAWRDDPQSPIRQIHVFAFGGLAKAGAWLTERGSWPARAGARAAIGG
ncbi:MULTISPECIES: methylenetetrahydrofolate reductase [unclassified Roseitalea]|uniref:methylenetetrahydrofolate reductase n=1 Tax=unclassified Roseitalea TaxID=2639107 RepID=UPI00273EA4A6|nr:MULTISPECIES: methylenetetrahydrofolate reductase [unclassified Roseitalea]